MVLESSQQAALTGMVSMPVSFNAPLADMTTLRIGGPADALVTLLDPSELQQVLQFCEREEIAWKLLGKGSNILAPDSGFRGLVLVLGAGFKTCELVSADDDPVKIWAGGGISLARLANWCQQRALSGLEFVAGIPGTVGGAVAMNAGAWGQEICHVISRVEFTDSSAVRRVVREDLHFSYRCLKEVHGPLASAVITGIELKLQTAHAQEIAHKMDSYREQRLVQQPIRQANAGSFFKNPPGRSAGKMIDAAGLKGYRIGGAEVSTKHANFVINRGGATAADVLALMRHIQDVVEVDSGVRLEPEVHIL